MMQRRPPAREAGFSLVETLIALAIIAAMTGVMADISVQDARAQAAVRDRRLAAIVARSALDRAAAGEGADAGEDAGLAWHIAREPYGDADPFDPLPLEQLAVTVASHSGQPLLTLVTVRSRK